MQDALGNPIEEGDLVAAAVSNGRSSGSLTIGFVTKLAAGPNQKYSIRFPERPDPEGRWKPRGGTSLFYHPTKIINLRYTQFEWPENWMEP